MWHVWLWVGAPSGLDPFTSFPNACWMRGDWIKSGWKITKGSSSAPLGLFLVLKHSHSHVYGLFKRLKHWSQAVMILSYKWGKDDSEREEICTVAQIGHGAAKTRLGSSDSGASPTSILHSSATLCPHRQVCLLGIWREGQPFHSAVRDGTEKRPGWIQWPRSHWVFQAGKGALQFSRWTRLSAGNEEEFGGLERLGKIAHNNHRERRREFTWEVE